MGYGQYSSGGGIDRTKADMLGIFASEGIAQARKGGKNRLDATRADGSRFFTLHETVVAELSADGSRLTLRDGGWPTPTTRTAWDDAVRAFGVTGLSPWADGFRSMPSKHEREVVYSLAPNDATSQHLGETAPRPFMVTGRIDFTRQMMPMLRGSTDGGNFAVTYDGVELRSASGATVAIKPKRILAALYRIDALARAGRGQFAGRDDTLISEGDFEVAGFYISLGRSAKYVCVGCHTFKTPDVRVFMREIASRWPDAVKPARAAACARP